MKKFNSEIKKKLKNLNYLKNGALRYKCKNKIMSLQWKSMECEIIRSLFSNIYWYFSREVKFLNCESEIGLRLVTCRILLFQYNKLRGRFLLKLFVEMYYGDFFFRKSNLRKKKKKTEHKKDYTYKKIVKLLQQISMYYN